MVFIWYFLDDIVLFLRAYSGMGTSWEVALVHPRAAEPRCAEAAKFFAILFGDDHPEHLEPNPWDPMVWNRIIEPMG